MILTNPVPPLSTTPTSFKIGSNSGVLFKERLASANKISKVLSIDMPSLTFLPRAWLDSLITVRIVPSTGLITAL